MKRIIVAFCSLIVLFVLQAEPLRVVSYNVENLFHPAHDSVAGEPKDDWEWTPEGERKWSYTRYYTKIENIARVLTNIGEWEGVDVVGLQEVENALCVKRLCYTIRRGEYDFVHYESPDRRGIDVALIYKKARVDTLKTERLKVKGERDGEKLVTRDILYVCARVDRRDTIHFFVCHLPSQRGGKTESEWKRQIAREVLVKAVDSVYSINPNAKIIVMGDMNSERMKVNGLTDKWTNDKRQTTNDQSGTHKFLGRWSCLDHFYVSPALDNISEATIYDAEWILEPDEQYLGLKPKRTYNGVRYQKGFSDHLPIVLRIR